MSSTPFEKLLGFDLSALRAFVFVLDPQAAVITTGTGYSNDARNQGKIKIFYQLHPQFGEFVDLVRRSNRGGEELFEVRWRDRVMTIPSWMFCPTQCRQHTFGATPVVGWQRLCELTELCQKHKHSD
jgi:hypothetical protein